MFGPFKKKSPTNPDFTEHADRYAGRPLLVVLENYILDCIGELPADKQVGIRDIVQRVWQGGDDWKASIRAQLQLEQSIEEEFRRLWSRNQELARQNGVELTPVDFARMIVDQNFAHLF